MKRMKPYTIEKNIHHDINGHKHSVFVDTRNGGVRKRWWTKARIPGTVRLSRLPGGAGYQGDKAWVTNGNSLQALEDAYGHATVG